MTPEGKVVNALKKACADCGLLYIRMTLRPGAAVGWPDFIVCGPGGRSLWVETKAPKKEATKMQLHRRDILVQYGHLWAKPDTPERAEEVIVNFAKFCIAKEGKALSDGE